MSDLAERRTLREVARVLGVSRMAVRRDEARAIRRLWRDAATLTRLLAAGGRVALRRTGPAPGRCVDGTTDPAHRVKRCAKCRAAAWRRFRARRGASA